MKRLLLIALPLILIVGCSQKPVEDSTLINKDGLMYAPDSDKPYTGEVFTNYSTGEKSYQGTYDMGLLVQYSYLNRDGTVKEPINYNTTLDRRGNVFYTKDTNKPYSGPVFSLTKKGQMEQEGILKNGKVVSYKLFEYYSNFGGLATKKSEESMIKDPEYKKIYGRDKPDGTWTYWYSDGTKEREVYFKNGISLGSKIWIDGYLDETIINDSTRVYRHGIENGQILFERITLFERIEIGGDEFFGDGEYSDKCWDEVGNECECEKSDYLPLRCKTEFTTESGLKYEVITLGTGIKPPQFSTVAIAYHGTLLDGRVFDSTVERDEYIKLGLNRVIKGLAEGVQLMPTGSKFKFIIPPELAYGEDTVGIIPPNSTLIYEVELFKVYLDE